jgi:uncharacterized protein (TIGR02145 family)
MKQLVIFLFFINICTNIIAQSVGIGTNTPNQSAKVDVTSTNQGFLPPRMTLTERNAVVNPLTGLTVYCTTCEELQVYSEGTWKNTKRESSCTFNGQAVAICNKVWTKKNLDVDHYRNGDIIPQVTDQNAWVNLTTGAWCYYNNDPALGAIYGKLYNWYAVNDARGLAPQGWHISTDLEWSILSACLGGDNFSGGAIKEAGSSHWYNNHVSSTNSSQLTVLPNGSRDQGGTFINLTWYTHMWSATSSTDIVYAFYRYLNYYDGVLGRYIYFKVAGMGVRCVKD